MFPRTASRLTARALYFVILLGITQITLSLWYITLHSNFLNGESGSSIMTSSLTTTNPSDEDGLSDVADDNEVNYSSSPTRPLCRRRPLIRNPMINITNTIHSMTEAEHQFKQVEAGGHYKPANCTARHKLAVIVPYSGHPDQLVTFLSHMHRFLQRQDIEYDIFLVELKTNIPFNRALQFNIGFLETSKSLDYSCYVFHDVDLLPLNNNNLYRCSKQYPRHLAAAIDTNKSTYKDTFWGVTAMTKEQFLKVNGYSNKYFEWGGEDDDMYERIKAQNMNVTRYSGTVPVYKKLSQRHETTNFKRHHFNSVGRGGTDGLTNLKYTVLKTSKFKLYTHILASVNTSDPRLKMDVVLDDETWTMPTSSLTAILVYFTIFIFAIGTVIISIAIYYARDRSSRHDNTRTALLPVNNVIG